MPRRWVTISAGLCFTAAISSTAVLPIPHMTKLQAEEEVPSKHETTPASKQEVRQRARLLHETVDGALQVMHRDFFDDDKSLTIPSRSLEDVFRVLERKQKVTLRWLAVNANAMSVDHNPQNDFERQAVKAITAGKTEHEQFEERTYRYAGMIRLGSECLKCHVPMRKSLEDRFAALVISIPYEPSPAE